MSKSLHLLLIEDSEADALLLLRELRRSGYQPKLERVDTPLAMQAALSKNKWDLIICDYSMPEFSAPAALQILQASGLDLPFIIVSATVGEEIAVAAMRAGAHDYLLKGNLTRLVPAIERELREAEVRLARKQAEEQLKASLQEKEVLLKEIHHRVKNNLQIISSLLNLQADYLKDKKALDVFMNSQRRIESMALIHEKLYQSLDLARINFADYVQDLVSSLFSAYVVNPETINLRLNIESIYLSVDIAIPCGLIINELVLNSLKHAFTRGGLGEIYIKISLANNKINLIIGDDGVGLPLDFDFETTESLGLQIVNTLTSQLAGRVEFCSNNGVEFQFSFPYKPKVSYDYHFTQSYQGQKLMAGVSSG